MLGFAPLNTMASVFDGVRRKRRSSRSRMRPDIQCHRTGEWIELAADLQQKLSLSLAPQFQPGHFSGQCLHGRHRRKASRRPFTSVSWAE